MMWKNDPGKRQEWLATIDAGIRMYVDILDLHGVETFESCQARPLRHTGPARDVLDYIEWMWHCVWVQTICSDTTTAITVFSAFQRNASAERGRSVAR